MGQTWDPVDYETRHGYVAALGEGVVELLAPRPGERILDLGCGDGVLSERIVAAGATVVGIDASAAMVEAARARGIDAHVGDAEHLPFADEFDAVFSNAAIHWMADHDAVCEGVARALRPGGRFIGEFGGAGNVASVLAALTEAAAPFGIDVHALKPWNYPTVAEWSARLEGAGFTVGHIELFERPTPVPDGLGAWLDTFCRSILDAFPPRARNTLRADTIRRAAPDLQQPDGTWVVDYVRLRFAARRDTSVNESS